MLHDNGEQQSLEVAQAPPAGTQGIVVVVVGFEQAAGADMTQPPCGPHTLGPAHSAWQSLAPIVPQISKI
jgi:hypothetical protein